MNKNSKFAVCEDVCFQECDEGLMVYVQSSGMVHIVNNVAGYIIKMCSSHQYILDEIVENVCTNYIGADRNVIEKDVNDIVEQFVQMGIVQSV